MSTAPDGNGSSPPRGMPLAHLSNLLSHLATGLAPLSPAVAEELRTLTDALEPYGTQTVTDLVEWLHRHDLREPPPLNGVHHAAPPSPDARPHSASTALPTPEPASPSTSPVAPSGARPPAAPHTVAALSQAVRIVLTDMDRGRVDARQVDRVIRQLGVFEPHELDALLLELGLAGAAPTKADALARVQQMLHNHADSALRLHLMRNARSEAR